MKPTAKKSVFKKNTRKKDGMTILLERIEDKIGLVSEGHSILERKIDGLDSRMDKLDSRMEKMDSKIDRIELKMDEGFKLVLSHLSGLDKEFMELKNDLKDNYEKKGHDAVWKKAIEERVGKLEKLLMAKRLAEA